MKNAVLAAGLTLAVPAMAIGAMWLPRVRGWSFTLMIFLTCLGAHASVNIVSRELYRGPDRGFEVTGSDLVCWALMLAMTLRFPGKITWFPRISWLLLLFFLESAARHERRTALYRLQFMEVPAHLFPLYLVYRELPSFGTHRRYAWFGFAAAAASVITLLALQQKYMLGIYRINGPFDHSNTVPLYANLILPVLLIWRLCDKELPLRWAVVSVALCFGLLFAVLWTLASRHCFVRRLRDRRSGMGESALPSMRVRAFTAVLGVGAVAGAIRAARPILERIRTAPEASGEARDEFNDAAQLMLAMILLASASKLFLRGHQPDAVPRALPGDEERRAVGRCRDPHLLVDAAETGYPGLLLYLLLIAGFAWSALAGSWRRKTVEDAAFAVFLGFALQTSGFDEWALARAPVTQLFTICAAMSVVWSEKPRPSLLSAARHPSCGADPQVAGPLAGLSHFAGTCFRANSGPGGPAQTGGSAPLGYQRSFSALPPFLRVSAVKPCQP